VRYLRAEKECGALPLGRRPELMYSEKYFQRIISEGLMTGKPGVSRVIKEGATAKEWTATTA
jgi:hypothetical protein